MLKNKINILNKKTTNSRLIKILSGSIISIIISILGFFIFAIILTNTDIKEDVIPLVIIIISIISILVGSIISSKKLNKKGIINGAFVGIIYISSIYFLSSFILVGFELNLYSIIIIIGSVISGMIGGIVGINFK